MPQGHLPRGGGKCVAVSRCSPHLDHLHAHHDRRTRTADRAPPPVGGCTDGIRRAGVGTHRLAGRRAYPLGATYDGAGTNFSLFSEVADRVELCLIGKDGSEERDQPRRGRRLRLALLSAHRHPGAALRLPGVRPVGSRRRASLRSEQAAARPLREVLPRRLRLQPGAVLLRLERRGPGAAAARRRWSTRWATP